MQILVGVVVMIAVVGLLVAALRPGRLPPTHIADADRDGEPDASPADKQAVIEADRAYQDELHRDEEASEDRR